MVECFDEVEVLLEAEVFELVEVASVLLGFEAVVLLPSACGESVEAEGAEAAEAGGVVCDIELSEGAVEAVEEVGFGVGG